MAFDVREFKANGLILGGARPANFQVLLTPPATLGASLQANQLQFLARATSIPAMPLDSVPVPYMGRKIKLSGDREFPDWTITVYNDEDFAMRLMFEAWSNKINYMVSNVMDPTMFPLDYKAIVEVKQFDKLGNFSRGYIMEGAFPTNIDAIPLDWDQINAVEQFDVTFAFDNWYPDNSSVYNTWSEEIGSTPTSGGASG